MIDHDEMKEQIITAAREIFARYGYKKTTMDDIAASIYKAKSSIYHYFNGKEDIFRAVIDRESSFILQEIEKAVGKETEPVAKLTTYFSTVFQEVKKAENYFRLLMDEWFEIFDFTDVIKRENEEKNIKFLASILREGNRTGDFAVENPEKYAQALDLGFNGYLFPVAMTHHSATIEDFTIYLKIILHGLLKR
jgi:AcrR family transcriptional regulator